MKQDFYQFRIFKFVGLGKQSYSNLHLKMTKKWEPGSREGSHVYYKEINKRYEGLNYYGDRNEEEDG